MNSKIYEIYFTAEFLYKVRFDRPLDREKAEALFQVGDFEEILESELISIIEVDEVSQSDGSR